MLLNHWKRDESNTHVLLMDATCYESYICFPTEVKLLWECCEWLFEKQLFKICKKTGTRRPHSKYQQQKRKQMAYARTRRKTFEMTAKRNLALTHLLGKAIGQLREVLSEVQVTA